MRPEASEDFFASKRCVICSSSRQCKSSHVSWVLKIVWKHTTLHKMTTNYMYLLSYYLVWLRQPVEWTANLHICTVFRQHLKIFLFQQCHVPKHKLTHLTLIFFTFDIFHLYRGSRNSFVIWPTLNLPYDDDDGDDSKGFNRSINIPYIWWCTR